MKALQDEVLPVEDHYIRFMAELHLPDSSFEEDEGDTDEDGKPFRIVICMTQNSSRRLCGAQFIQFDIGLKHIIGFYELEIGGLHDDSRTSLLLFPTLPAKYS